jgi:Mn-dependent DtxR family transcriptional regulator
VAAERPTHEGDGIVLTESGREMTREIRRRMNLSSDTEAANMMIAVAYKTLQNLLR